MPPPPPEVLVTPVKTSVSNVDKFDKHFYNDNVCTAHIL